MIKSTLDKLSIADLKALIDYCLIMANSSFRGNDYDKLLKFREALYEELSKRVIQLIEEYNTPILSNFTGWTGGSVIGS